MELLSLPDEMLASVFKYAKFQTVTTLRKLNQRIDGVSVRFGISKPRLHSITLSRRRRWPLHIEYMRSKLFENKQSDIADVIGSTGQRLEVMKRLTLPIEDDDNYITFKKYMSKIDRVEWIFLYDTMIDEMWVNLLDTYKRPNRTKIFFTRCDMDISEQRISPILRKFKEVRMVIDESNRIQQRKFNNDKVLCSLLTSGGYFTLGDPEEETRIACEEITDETLRFVNKVKPKQLDLSSCFCSFTIGEVKKALMEFKTDDKPDDAYWRLGYIRIHSRERMANILGELKLIEGVKNYSNEETPHISYSEKGNRCEFKFRMFCEEN